MGSSQLQGAVRDPLSREQDFSTPHLFNLTTDPPDKTIDIGRNGFSVSLDAQGRVLQASTYHPDHGIVLASPFEQFDGTKFYDVAYVREYRTRMLHLLQHNRAGFGLDLGFVDHVVAIKIIETSTALYRFNLPDDIEVSIVAQVLENRRFVQYAKIDNRGSTPILLPYALRANVSLNRASYGQLTEGGPIPIPPSHNFLQTSSRNALCIHNPNLGTRLQINLDINGSPYDFKTVQEHETHGAPLKTFIEDETRIAPGETARIRATFHLLPQPEANAEGIRPMTLGVLDDIPEDVQPHWKNDKLLSTYITRRNFEYIMANCSIPISATSVAVITDHVALPLGWNRDNYWQIGLLRATRANLNSLIHRKFFLDYERSIRKVARGHLEWVFTKAERPNGFWQRSYLVNGKPKDSSVFQLDQQCYPLLELCEFLDHFPEEIKFVNDMVATGVIQDIISILHSKKNAQTGLWPTDETPGDDAVAFPHHFSSHVLLWRTFTRLNQLFRRLNIPQHHQGLQLDLVAGLRKRTIEAFSATRPECGTLMFAYLTDGHGRYTFYHDANDVPTLYASEWEFVSTPKEMAIWNDTMRFGFSPTNEKGYSSDGPYGGLGSVHSPGAWTLGYFQELAYAAHLNDVPAIQAAWAKIAAAMHWDGTLAEAVDPITAKCTSKAWFSWPGAMIGTLLIKMRGNGQEMFLSSAAME